MRPWPSHPTARGQRPLLAIEKAGADHAAIRGALEETDFVGCSGIFRMSPTDHAGMALESITGGQLVDGQWTIILD